MSYREEGAALFDVETSTFIRIMMQLETFFALSKIHVSICLAGESAF